MDFTQFIRPELLILILVLWVLGKILKGSKKIEDWTIPIILCVVSVAFTFMWIMGWKMADIPQNVFAFIFTALVQGILIAGAAVYTENIIKQVSVGRIEDRASGEGINTPSDNGG